MLDAWPGIFEAFPLLRLLTAFKLARMVPPPELSSAQANAGGQSRLAALVLRRLRIFCGPREQEARGPIGLGDPVPYRTMSGILVGLPGFEPGTSCTPSKRASQAAPQPEGSSLAGARAWRGLAARDPWF